MKRDSSLAVFNFNGLSHDSSLGFTQKRNYWRKRSCGQGNVFTGVCLSTGGRVSASVHAGMPDPPGWRTPPDGDPPGMETPLPPGWRTPPPGKQTAIYGQRAAGTHPPGMHSCCGCFFLAGGV